MLNPWGSINWLMPRIGDKRWTTISCASFEDRSVAVPAWVAVSGNYLAHFVIRIDDPESRFTKQLDVQTDRNQAEILALLKSTVRSSDCIDFRRESLLSEPSVWNRLAFDASSSPNVSIVLDISSMPKRVFLFLAKQLLASPNVQDLIVCYARAEGYKEGFLTEDAEPPAALPGYVRIADASSGATLIVSVGYTAFNLEDLLQQARGSDLKFLFPFPPGSPAFRRNWGLLHKLLPDVPIKTEIQRLHAMDMFAALQWITTVSQKIKGGINLIPLGPKPHALAMAMAYRKIGDAAEVLYSQPHMYHPEYSNGIAKARDGQPDILAYCLRRNKCDYV